MPSIFKNIRGNCKTKKSYNANVNDWETVNILDLKP